MRTPTWKPQVIHTDDDFTYVLEFEEEHVNARDHFLNECGWSEDEYKPIANFYWFSSRIVAYKGDVEIYTSEQYMGCHCFKNLKDVLSHDDVKSLDNTLGGYGPQIVEECREAAIKSLATEYAP